VAGANRRLLPTATAPGSSLEHLGLRDPALIEELGLGYAPGGNLRRHLAEQGYGLEVLFDTGLIHAATLSAGA
jgi:hypothetical protein